MRFAGRHVVASSTNRRVLIAAQEREVVVCDLEEMTCTEPISTTFDFGGSRLALSDEVNGIVAAAYQEHGVALYSADNGVELWRRRDITRVQTIELSCDGTLAYCGREADSLTILDVQTGSTLHTLRGARRYLESPYDHVRFIDGKTPKVLADQTSVSVPRSSFAFLSAEFGPGILVVSEAGGVVRCVDVVSGVERWKYTPPTDSHVLTLGYRQEPTAFMGVEWDFVRGSRKRLVTLSPSDGRLMSRVEFGEITDPLAVCFAMSGRLAVLANGNVLDTRSCMTIGNLLPK